MGAARVPNSTTQTGQYFEILKSAGLPEEEWLLRSASQRRTTCLCNVGAVKGEIYLKVCKVRVT